MHGYLTGITSQSIVITIPYPSKKKYIYEIPINHGIQSMLRSERIPYDNPQICKILKRDPIIFRVYKSSQYTHPYIKRCPKPPKMLNLDISWVTCIDADQITLLKSKSTESTDQCDLFEIMEYLGELPLYDRLFGDKDMYIPLPIAREIFFTIPLEILQQEKRSA